MGKIRKNPIYNRWVIIADERSKRPHAFYREEELEDKKDCPFCEGSEEMTPPEIDSFRVSGKPNKPGWKVRVVPNKYPALIPDVEFQKNIEGLFHIIPATGTHEVIIETPHHNKNQFNMDEEETSLILKMYRKRYLTLKENKNLEYILIFKNHGRVAGGSLPHSHSQVIGLPLTPPYIEEELALIKKRNECLFCKLIQRAENDKRVLTQNKNFIVIAPFASISPYELAIYPLKHKPRFEEITDPEIDSFSEIFHDVFKRYNKLLGKLPFNYFLHTSPIDSLNKDYHWHIVILPKLTITAGFEKGTNIYINLVAPERAVGELRKVKRQEER